jgi:hypothetical protein
MIMVEVAITLSLLPYILPIGKLDSSLHISCTAALCRIFNKIKKRRKYDNKINTDRSVRFHYISAFLYCRKKKANA